MKPLQAIGLGIVWIVLTTQGTRVDWFPDPVGWALALIAMPGLRRIPELVPYWTTMLVLALVALVTSTAVWLPTGGSFVEDEPALGWAVNLPDFAFLALLCHGLAAAAYASDDPYGHSSSTWLRMCEGLLVAVAVAPVLVFGGGWDALGPWAATGAQVALLATMLLCFAYGSRPWAGVPEPATPTE